MNSNYGVFHARLPHPAEGGANVLAGSGEERNSSGLSTLRGVQTGQGENELPSRRLESLLMQAITCNQPAGFWRTRLMVGSSQQRKSPPTTFHGPSRSTNSAASNRGFL